MDGQRFEINSLDNRPKSEYNIWQRPKGVRFLIHGVSHLWGNGGNLSVGTGGRCRNLRRKAESRRSPKQFAFRMKIREGRKGRMAFKDKLARLIRMITVPAVLVTAFLVIFYLIRRDLFSSCWEMIAGICFLGLFPILAYPFQLLIPKLKETGRKGQRRLAFLFSFIGYVGGLLYGIIAEVSAPLLLVFITYFISVLSLTVINKGLKIRASGHACSITAPCFFLSYFCGWYLCFPCILIAIASFWASLHLKRHTKTELFCGVMTCLFSLAISLLFYFFVL